MDMRWLRLSQWVACELKQAEQEGKDLTKLRGKKEGLSEEDAIRLCDAVAALPMRKDYPYVEPNDYGEIAATFPADEVYAPLTDAQLIDKIRGMWYARIVGCELGKPIEGYMRNVIVTLAKETGNYPIRDYIDDAKFTDEVRQTLREKCDKTLHDKWWKQTFKQAGHAFWDDDLNYTAINLLLLETYGKNFTSDDVLSCWANNLPVAAACTAEKVAYRNGAVGLTPPETGRRGNPFREWFGAGIRADIFGYVNPGNPREAAHMAYKDACISHVKNGIYGEMYFAALIAIAFYESDPETLVKKALGYIPPKSRLAEAVRNMIAVYESGADRDAAIRYIHDTFDEYDPQTAVHTLPNVVIAVASLLYGNNDCTAAWSVGMETGFDTDSHGATVGSVIGAVRGFGGVEPRWYEPFHGMLETRVTEYGVLPIETLVEKTLKVIKD